MVEPIAGSQTWSFTQGSSCTGSSDIIMLAII